MKRFLLSIFAISALGLSANAQLKVGNIAPDFTLTDINGQSHQLYKYLDSGYSVVLDISAAWCGPCWSFHNTHVMEALENQYGTNGTVMPKKIKCIYVEGESTNTLAQLQGNGTSGGGANRATDTQGDWISGSNYIIIDNASLNSLYQITGFPSLYMICPDRLISVSSGGYSSAMGQVSYWVNAMNSACPTYMPNSPVDAKAVGATSSQQFLCQAKPTVTFQNWGTAPLTSATIKIYNNNAVVATQPWTGSLASKAFANVTLTTPFTPTNSTAYDVEVVATGDNQTANNRKNNIAYQALSAADAFAIPFTENWSTITTTFPAKYLMKGVDDDYLFTFAGNATYPITGPDGVVGNKALCTELAAIPTNDSALMVIGFNNQSAANSSLEFDFAYARTNASSSDKFDILISTNCGTSWTTLYNGVAANMKTSPDVTGTAFVPNSTSVWKHHSFSLNSHKSAATWIKFKWTDGGGNKMWMDNLRVTNTTGIQDVVGEDGIRIHPNPAVDQAILSVDLLKAGKVSVSIVDAMGRVVNQIAEQSYSAGKHSITLNTTQLASGIYNVRIQTEGGSIVEKLTVAK